MKRLWQAIGNIAEEHLFRRTSVLMSRMAYRVFVALHQQTHQSDTLCRYPIVTHNPVMH